MKVDKVTATTNDSPVMIHWLLFLIFTVITIVLLMFYNQFFWLALPFVLVEFVMALRVV